MTKHSSTKQPTNASSQLLNVLLNVIIPSFIMLKLSQSQYLGPTNSLILALSFPLTYAGVGFIKHRQLNFFSVLGFISILLTASIGLLKLNPEWIAYKEASIPLVFGLAIIVSQKTSKPLVKTFLSQIINLNKINLALTKSNKKPLFEQKLTLSSYFLGFSYLVSALLNYTLAKLIVTGNPGTQAFTQQLGKMTALSYPVIVFPMTLSIFAVIFYLVRTIKLHTNLKLEDMFLIS